MKYNCTEPERFRANESFEPVRFHKICSVSQKSTDNFCENEV